MITKRIRMEPAMNDPIASTGTTSRSRQRKPVILIAIAAILAAIAVAYTAGYRVGVARQEKRLLNEFLINAVNLGILDVERLRELTTEAGTNMESDATSIRNRTGEP